MVDVYWQYLDRLQLVVRAFLRASSDGVRRTGSGWAPAGSPSPISKRMTAAAALTGNSGGRFDSSASRLSPSPCPSVCASPLPAPARIPANRGPHSAHCQRPPLPVPTPPGRNQLPPIPKHKCGPGVPPQTKWCKPSSVPSADKKAVPQNHPHPIIQESPSSADKKVLPFSVFLRVLRGQTEVAVLRVSPRPPPTKSSSPKSSPSNNPRIPVLRVLRGPKSSCRSPCPSVPSVDKKVLPFSVSSVDIKV